MLRRTLFVCLATIAFSGHITSAQVAAPVPVLIQGLVKVAPAGIDNPNDLPGDKPLSTVSDASPQQLAITKRAFELANAVASAPQFLPGVLSMDIPGCYQKNYYDQTFHYSNRGVYDKMLANSSIKLDVIWYDGEHPNGVGSNQGYEVTIFPHAAGVNKNAVVLESSDEKKAAFLASTLLHESSHVAGFRHDRNHCWFHDVTRSVSYNMNALYYRTALVLQLPVSDYAPR